MKYCWISFVFFICLLLTILQLEWMCIILSIVLHFFNLLVSNFKKLRMFSHNQMKYFNANIAMLRVVFYILLEMDLQSSFVTHKVLIDEFLNHLEKRSLVQIHCVYFTVIGFTSLSFVSSRGAANQLKLSHFLQRFFNTLV